MGRTFDSIIIGSGQAALFLTARLAAAGQTVALVERKFLSGTCVNTGCTPTKAMGITLDVYTQAVNSNKRAAQSKVVKMMVSSEGTKAAIAGTTTPRKEVNNLLTVGHTFRKYFECMAGTTGLEPATS